MNKQSGGSVCNRQNFLLSKWREMRGMVRQGQKYLSDYVTSEADENSIRRWIDENWAEQRTEVERMHEENVKNWKILTGLDEENLPLVLRLKFDTQVEYSVPKDIMKLLPESVVKHFQKVLW